MEGKNVEAPTMLCVIIVITTLLKSEGLLTQLASWGDYAGVPGEKP